MRAVVTASALLALTIQPFAPSAGAQQSFTAAAEYSRTHRGDALLVLQGDSIVFEQYQNGYASTTPHMLASGSKSFSCAIAVAAVQDGLLTLDEAIANTLPELRGSSGKERITVRQLLSLTSGLEGGAVATPFTPLRTTRRADALDARLQSPPGTVFRYGPTAFDLFGELMHRKLGGETVDAYLQRRVLTPIGLTELEWRRDREGRPVLPGGAFTTAREWVKYGQLIRDEGRWRGTQLLDPALLRECTTPSAVTNNYGLTFWLSSAASEDLADRRGRRRRAPQASSMPRPVIMAAGAGMQRLYVLREHDLVVVRLGRTDPNWSDTTFLEALLTSASLER